MIEYFESAFDTIYRANKDTEKLNASYQLILDAQKKYGVELTNNKEFDYWTISDYDLTWCYENGNPKPQFSDDYVQKFGNGVVKVKALRSIDQVEQAITTLFWFRENNCMENAIMYRLRQLDQPYFPADEFEMCSLNT